ncbi:hypothetical protein P5G51_009020 [Virgibacillus sp. 179-BFC.A HS]|uniref:DUF3679 domain-containing protein n=1 Tax=Tigheibacillus jepli TaxID=3035914 RepID=A0ABU5CJ36_9BACI|nr:hypothetical protein [Virgibacillus sp. 179-BFC.A HS]MDY0405520.1 hypothetical protein [Virgibacillus sp. 179-BFC.A HS]
MRYVMILLLFVVFFLAGTVFGINRYQQDTIQETGQSDVIVSKPERDSALEEQSDNADKTDESAVDIINMEQSPTFMQKTASLLGAGVKHIFEVLANMLYQIAKAFF